MGGSANAIVPNYFLAPITAGGAGPGGYDYAQEEFFGELCSSATAALTPCDGTNRYNYAPINHFLRPLTQWSAGAFVDYQVNEHFTPYVELMVFERADTRADC